MRSIVVLSTLVFVSSLVAAPAQGAFRLGPSKRVEKKSISARQIRALPSRVHALKKSVVKLDYKHVTDATLTLRRDYVTTGKLEKTAKKIVTLARDIELALQSSKLTDSALRELRRAPVDAIVEHVRTMYLDPGYVDRSTPFARSLAGLQGALVGRHKGAINEVKAAGKTLGYAQAKLAPAPTNAAP